MLQGYVGVLLDRLVSLVEVSSILHPFECRMSDCLTIIDYPAEVWIDVDPQTTGLLAFGCVGAKGMDLMLITGDSYLNMSWAWFTLCLAFGLSHKRKNSSESLSWNKS